jgi:hypothetical protein
VIAPELLARVTDPATAKSPPYAGFFVAQKMIERSRCTILALRVLF